MSQSSPAKAPKAKPAETAAESVETVAVQAADAESAAATEAKAETAAPKAASIIDRAALKANAEQIMATVGKARIFSSEAVKKARAASADAVKKARTYNKDNVDALMASAAAANKGAWALQMQSFMFPQKVLTETAAAALKLTTIKSAKDVAGVYGACAASLVKLHLAEADKATATLAGALTDTVMPIRRRIEETVAAAG